jgi:V-type H+-transporting ATPase subunit a
MNHASLSRPFRRYIQRLDEMDRIVRFLFETVASTPGYTITKNRLDDFLANESFMTLDSVEETLGKLYRQFVDFKANNDMLAEQETAAVEERYVNQTAEKALGALAGGASEALLGDRLDDGMVFSKVAGAVARVDQERFARTLFRATRGNTFTHFEEISDLVRDARTGRSTCKSVFVVYFQGATSSAMYDKVTRICQAFGVSTYQWPATQGAARSRIAQLDEEISYKKKTLEGFESLLRSELLFMVEKLRDTGNSRLEEWRLFVLKEKAVYATMNMFEGSMTLRANVWFPEDEAGTIQALLADESRRRGASAMLVVDQISAGFQPPTYIKRNDYTWAFQELVETYGVAIYKEANPALFTIVTFPFIFGVMYGDVGHGSCLFIAALLMLYYSDSLKYSAPSMYKARFLFLSMGFFAIYNGFIYNDFFGIGLNVFGSRWKQIGDSQYFEADYDITNNGGTGPYPFGLDPAWIGASNELLFVNSFKMKVSVILGVLQMLVGLMFRFSNAFYHIKSHGWIDLLCECIPMLIFMVCFFGYMDFMILYKWVTPMDQPPMLINTLICMGLGQKDPMPLYESQSQVQPTLMLLVAITLPWILIPKPIILYLRHKASSKGKHAEGYVAIESHDGGAIGDHTHEEEFELGEVVIHQLIETIEYILGTVSHTASYLRQWALSLAHQQLSLVFLQKTLLIAMNGDGGFGQGVKVYIAFAVWAGITAGVLLGMDVLECFLHTLRLHWVEFQSKFYNPGGHCGHSFVPFRHSTSIAVDV